MMKRFKLLTMAALVALSVAACDEGDGGLTADGTGTVSGRVTVDGAGRQGVVVTLGTTPARTTTTDASGNYSFADVGFGAVTVSIPAISGVTFDATSKVAVVATDGQTVTVDFAGSTIRNSQIAATVTGSSGPLAGVAVTLTGAGTGSTTTNASGVASFTGLAAGNYTVAITAPAGQTCAVTSQAVTLGAGELRAVSFNCTSASNGSITGRLFIDENDKNNVFDGATLEDNLMVANVLITLEGPTIGNVRTTQTDANGNYSFTGLPAGQYNVTIDSDDPDLPDNVEYGLSSENIGPITLAAGGTAQANFAFDIVEQTVLVYAFLGRDANDANSIDPSIPTGIAPVEDVIIELYPTEEDADDGTNLLDRDTTDADGEVQLTFDRDLDTSPGVGGPDQIVFARIRNPLPTGMARNGEAQFEIRYQPRQATVMAPDTFDLLNTDATVAVDVVGINGEELEGWRVRIYDDTTAAPLDNVLTDADGRATFDISTAIGALPQTFWFRLAPAQAAAGTHGFEATPSADEGEVQGRFVAYEHQGIVPPNDTADAGDIEVRFSDTDVVVYVYHEADDSLGYTGGDNTVGAAAVNVTLTWHDDAEDADSSRTVSPVAGEATFANVPTGQSAYTITADGGANRIILEDDSLTIGTGGDLGDLEGGSPETEVCVVTDACGTLAFKFDNGHITGRVRSSAPDLFPVEDVEIRVRAHPMTIQPRPEDSTVTTNASGRFRMDAREGMYIVSVVGAVLDADGDTLWAFDGVTEDTVDVEGNADTVVVNFTATRMNTSITGVVANDRDADQNTLDADEALAGVTVRLYSGDAVDEDELVGETETDASGGYTFAGLREGEYTVEAVQSVDGAVVLTGYDGNGDVVNTVTVTTTATDPADDCTDADNLSRVGVSDPTCFTALNPLPRWDYATSTALNVDAAHFTFLFSTGEARGTITDASSGNPVAGMTVFLTRCLTAATAPSPPRAGSCTTNFPGFAPLQATTSASGAYSFGNLEEGVYQVEPIPSSVAGYFDVDPTNPAGSTSNTMRFTISGNGDVETGNFTADN